MLHSTRRRMELAHKFSISYRKLGSSPPNGNGWFANKIIRESPSIVPGKTTIDLTTPTEFHKSRLGTLSSITYICKGVVMRDPRDTLLEAEKNGLQTGWIWVCVCVRSGSSKCQRIACDTVLLQMKARRLTTSYRLCDSCAV